jgi:hypothetical protein
MADNWSGWARLGMGIAGYILTGSPIGFIGGTILGSILFPQKYDTQKPQVGSYPVQGAEVGTPVPVLYGTRRVAGNVIWVGPQRTYIVKQDSGGGKGGGGSGPTTETVYYKRSFLIGVCIGPASVRKAWQNKDELALSKFTWFDGNNNEGIPALTGEEYTTYKHLACAFFEDYNLGTSGALPNFVFEVSSSFVSYGQIAVGQGATGAMLFDQNFQQLANVASPPYDLTYHVHQGPDGYFYSGSGNDPARGNKNHPFKMDKNFVVVPGWPVYDVWDITAYPCYSCRPTPDGKFVYTATRKVPGFKCTYIKLNANDGSLVWAVDGPDWGLPGWDIGIVQSIDLVTLQPVYDLVVANYQMDSYGNYFPAVLSGIDGSVRVNYYLSHQLKHTCSANYRMVVVDSLSSNNTAVPIDSKFFICGSGATGIFNQLGIVQGYSYQLIQNPLNGTYSYGGVRLWDFDPFIGYGTCLGITYKNGFIYAGITRRLYESDYVSVFKINATTGIMISHCDLGESCQDIFINAKNQLVAVTPSDTTNFWNILDDDLNVIETAAKDNTPVTSWTLWRAEQVPDWVAFGTATDEYPSSIIKDIIQTQTIAEIDEDNFDAALAYCQANDIKVSLFFKEQKPIWDCIDYICSHFNAFRYRSNGKICLGIFKEDDSIITLTKDDFVREENKAVSPVAITKRKYRESYNRIELQWTNREKVYAEGIALATDETDMRLAGQIRKNTVQLDGIMNSTLAQKMVYRLLAESMYRFHSYNFVVGFKNMLFEINDVITLNDGYKVIDKKVRILNVNEDPTGKNLAIEAVEEIDYPDVLFGMQTNEHSADEPATLASGVIASREDINAAKLYLSITPGGADTNGWWIYRSYDGLTYELVGRATIAGVTDGDANSAGILTSNLPAYPTVIHTSDDSFLVSIGTVTDLNNSITDDDFFNNRKLAKIDDEIIAYRTCVETATAGIWQVSNLIRGLFGTEPVEHLSGATFHTLDTNLTYAFRPEDIGKTLYFKAVAFYGNQEQEISDVLAQAVTIQGLYTRPASIGLPRLTAVEMDGGAVQYSGSSFILYWNLPGKKGTGFNQGGFDLNADYPVFNYGDSELNLVGGNGVNYGNYLADPELQGIDLVFETAAGVLIGQRSILPTAESEVIDKATDLGGNSDAIVKVIPRRSLRSINEMQIEVLNV